MSDVTKKNLLSVLKKYHAKNKESITSINKSIETTNKELSTRSNPNLLINGDFKIWQRGDSIVCNATDGYRKYTADRWRPFDGNQLNGNTSGVISATFEKYSDVNNGFPHCMKITAGSPGFVFVRSQIEGYFYGKPLTLSFYVKGPKGSSIVTTISDHASTTTYLTGEWQKITATTKKFSYTGGSIWAEPIRYISTAGEYIISEVKLEIGEIATPFVARTIAEELAMCQRYYEIINPFRIHNYTSQATFPMASANINVNYKVTKRVKPTVKFEYSFSGSEDVWNKLTTTTWSSMEGFTEFTVGNIPINGYMNLRNITVDAEIY